MNCRQVQQGLLEAEDARLDARASAGIAEHLRTCRDCRLLERELAELEQAWRSLPVPAGSEESKRAFLARLAVGGWRLAGGGWRVVGGSGRMPRRRVLRWCAASAASLLAAGSGAWFLLAEREARAADDLLDQLMDWNLDLTLAQSESERNRVYAEQAERFRSAFSRVRLSEEQRPLAKDLLENGSWLVAHQDPVVEADRFGSLADELLRLAQAAGVRGNTRRMDKLLRQYNRVLQSGIDLNTQRAEALDRLDRKQQAKLERLALRDADHLERLASLLETAPGATRKEIERAIRVQRDRKKRKKEK